MLKLHEVKRCKISEDKKCRKEEMYEQKQKIINKTSARSVGVSFAVINKTIIFINLKNNYIFYSVKNVSCTFYRLLL